MSETTAFNAYQSGQDAGIQAVVTLFADPRQWDRLIGLELLTVDARPIIAADQAAAGVDGLDGNWFVAGWYSGLRLAFVIRLQDRPFSARYITTAEQKEAADLAAMRTARVAKDEADQVRRAALFGADAPVADGEAATS